MAQRLVKITLVNQLPVITARLRPTNSNNYIFKVFEPGRVYGVDENGFNDLRISRTIINQNDEILRVGNNLNLTHSVKKVGCSKCSKAKKLVNFEFYTFIEVDEFGKILNSEFNGLVPKL